MHEIKKRCCLTHCIQIEFKRRKILNLRRKKHLKAIFIHFSGALWWIFAILPFGSKTTAAPVVLGETTEGHENDEIFTTQKTTHSVPNNLVRGSQISLVNNDWASTTRSTTTLHKDFRRLAKSSVLLESLLKNNTITRRTTAEVETKFVKGGAYFQPLLVEDGRNKFTTYLKKTNFFRSTDKSVRFLFEHIQTPVPSSCNSDVVFIPKSNCSAQNPAALSFDKIMDKIKNFNSTTSRLISDMTGYIVSRNS